MTPIEIIRNLCGFSIIGNLIKIVKHLFKLLFPDHSEGFSMLPNKYLIVKKTIQVLNFEEGYRETAYLDTNGYLTIAGGFKMSNTKNLDPSDFLEFKIPREAGDIMKKLKIEQEVLPQFEQHFYDIFFHEPERVAI